MTNVKFLNYVQNNRFEDAVTELIADYWRDNNLRQTSDCRVLYNFLLKPIRIRSNPDRVFTWNDIYDIETQPVCMRHDSFIEDDSDGTTKPDIRVFFKNNLHEPIWIEVKINYSAIITRAESHWANRDLWLVPEGYNNLDEDHHIPRAEQYIKIWSNLFKHCNQYGASLDKLKRFINKYDLADGMKVKI